jgi:general secretion pathway protein E
MRDIAENTKNILRYHSPQPEALQLVPEAMARKFSAIPVYLEGNVLHVAMADSTNILALEALASWSQMRIEPEPSTAEAVIEAIDFNYKSYEEIEKQISSISPTEGGRPTNKQLAIDTATEAPVAQALTLIVDEAVKARASDIHIEPGEDRVRVRYRIDGSLHDMFSLPLATMTPVISRIKILANMNIADHHRPQDGQFSVKAKGRQIDIRVGIIPTVYGEMAVLRLLDKSRATLTLADLGFLPDSLAKYESMLKVPYGIILVSGPTGAGKTTTLYASVNSLDQTERNIITVEDPVEYRFSNINQIQVNPRAGITFASGLRSILRLDPDVILIANDAVGVVLRLVDLGVEPFLVSSALIGVVAQRMVRRLCPNCARPVEASPEETVVYSQEIGEERKEFLYGAGCKACSNSGYRGRTGIFEILTTSNEIKRLLVKGTTANELRAAAMQEGMTTLLGDGMTKVKNNSTTPTEVLRNTYSIG